MSLEPILHKIYRVRMRGNKGRDLFLGEVPTISMRICVRSLDRTRPHIPLTARGPGHCFVKARGGEVIKPILFQSDAHVKGVVRRSGTANLKLSCARDLVPGVLHSEFLPSLRLGWSIEVIGLRSHVMKHNRASSKMLHVQLRWMESRRHGDVARENQPRSIRNSSETYVTMRNCSPCNYRSNVQDKGLVTLPSGARQERQLNPSSWAATAEGTHVALVRTRRGPP